MFRSIEMLRLASRKSQCVSKRSSEGIRINPSKVVNMKAFKSVFQAGKIGRTRTHISN